MTEDIKAISKSFVPIVSVLLLQPPIILAYLYYSFTLFKWSPLILLGHFFMASGLLRIPMNPILRFTARNEQAEGDLRLVHVMTKNRAEAIAISDGGVVHRAEANKRFDRVTQMQICLTRWFSVNTGIQSFFSYSLAIWAYGIVFMSIGSGNSKIPPEKIGATASFIASRLLDAMLKMSMVTSLMATVPVASAQALRLLELFDRLKAAGNGPDAEIPMQEVVLNSQLLPSAIPGRAGSSASQVEAVCVSFEGVDLYSPDEQLLVYGFTLKIWPGKHTIIHGPSGSGKSSLIRCLSGVWRCRHGSAAVYAPPGLARPPIMYIPQLPVIVSGTILDQLFYPFQAPCDPADFATAKENVIQAVQAVSLWSLFQQRLSASFDASISMTEWHELMSPGELQRLVIARLFLHLPVFAVLDEAMNAIDSTREQEIYELLWAAGITTISVSHRVGFIREAARIAVFLDGHGNHQIEQK